MFPDNDKAREWLEAQIWPHGPRCPHCGSDNVQSGIKHKTMTHRCRDCPNKPRLSLKVGTVMQASNLGYRDWAIAVYLLTTNLKSVSSMNLHRDLEIAYSSAWHLSHRLRAAFEGGDAALFGGKRKNMPVSKRKEMTNRGPVGKTAIASVKDRETSRAAARKVQQTDTAALQSVVRDCLVPGATLYTDESVAYSIMPEFENEAVNHSVGECVKELAYTNGIERFWAMLKRAIRAHSTTSPTSTWTGTSASSPDAIVCATRTPKT